MCLFFDLFHLKVSLKYYALKIHCHLDGLPIVIFRTSSALYQKDARMHEPRKGQAMSALVQLYQ